ncbi:MAG: septum formation protein Maf [Bacteroidales bacterium]|nr:septum formation protein Maf [Bacteroidales bacterium]
MNKLVNYKLLLASKSPRRKQLVSMLGFGVEMVEVEADENVKAHVPASEMPVLLAELKSLSYTKEISSDEILLTADTLVVLNDAVLGKPHSRQEAFDMLSLLSGRKHQVYTGVCLRTSKLVKLFTEVTDVYFKELSNNEINYYLDNYNYSDKAGSYGIQEWIGMIGVKRIEGDFYNVMGLPIARLYKEIMFL